MTEQVADPSAVIRFWFSDRVRPRWFRSTPELDQKITERFLGTWTAASRGELSAWEASPEDSLALSIVLDQLPLNIFRSRPASFSTEQAAVAVAERAIERAFDRRLTEGQKPFLYMPFMHSELLAHQERSVDLFTEAGLEDNARWARHHRNIILRFGRFPHRNEILGRQSTAQELAYLQSQEAFLG